MAALLLPAAKAWQESSEYDRDKWRLIANRFNVLRNPGVDAHVTATAFPDRKSDLRAADEALGWSRKGRPEPVLLETVRDAPREGPVRDELRAAVAVLRERL